MAPMEERNRRLSSKHSIHSSTNGIMHTGTDIGPRGTAMFKFHFGKKRQAG
jgi:hypothetical protein